MRSTAASSRVSSATRLPERGARPGGRRRQAQHRVVAAAGAVLEVDPAGEPARRAGRLAGALHPARAAGEAGVGEQQVGGGAEAGERQNGEDPGQGGLDPLPADDRATDREEVEQQQQPAGEPPGTELGQIQQEAEHPEST